MQIRPSIKIIFAVVLVALGLFLWWLHADAATYIWEQAAWTGGLDGGTYPVHPTNETGWTKYSAADPLISISSAGVTVSSTTGSTTQTTDTDFNAGTFASTTVVGTGTPATVTLSQPTQSSADTWVSRTTVPTFNNPGPSQVGAAGYIYAIGPPAFNSTSNAFNRYSSSSNAWTGMAAPAGFGVTTAFSTGVYTGGNLIYFLMCPNSGSSCSFQSYSISGNSWSTLATPSGTGATNLYMTYANGIIYVSYTGGLLAYSVTNNSWSLLTSSFAETSIYYPGSGNLIYGVAGSNMYSYSISGNSTTTLAGSPTAFNANISAGINNSGGVGLMGIPGGNFLYASAGGNSGVLMRYSISGNSWTTLGTMPSVMGLGNSITYPGMGNFFYASMNSGGWYQYDFSKTYNPVGTFTSSVIDLGQDSTPTTFGFTSSTPGSTTLAFQMRSAPTSGGVSSATWYGPTGTSDYYTSTGQNINQVLAHNRYFQYKAFATTTDLSLTLTPVLSDATINYIYYPATTTLTSSAYNAGDPNNIVANLKWTASSTASTSVIFQIRSAPNATGTVPGTWTAFVGPDGTSNTYFASSTGGDLMPSILASNSQWFEYKAYITSIDGTTPPASFSDVQVKYAVNASPQLNNASTSASEIASGTVPITYSVLDPDTNTGTVTPGFVTPSFQYSLNGGSTWTNISSSSLGGTDLSNKAVSTSTYTAYTATWTPTLQIPNSYSTSTKIRVIVNDNEAANNIASSTSSIFTLDTTPPAPGPIPIVIDESQASPLITLSATDNSTFYMKVGRHSDLSDAPSWIPYTSTTTLSLGAGDSVYAQFMDAYGNQTAILSATPPETPSNVFYQDTSNPQTLDWKIFFAWGVIDNPNAGFQGYNVYRAQNGGAYSLLTTITNRNINYYVDSGLNTTVSYSYKVVAEDSNNDLSFFSSSITHIPNGTGGTDLSVPVLSNVTVSNVTSTGATITWTTNKFADSTVFYSATSTYPGSVSSSYQTSSGVPAVVESHSVTLTNLTPGTQYYFMSQSTDPNSNIGTSANSTYTFNTTAGPVISNTTASSILDTSATITWNTDAPSNSTVYYSTSPTMSSPSNLSSGTLTTNHSITLTGLTHGMKYYYYVTSADSSGNTAVDNNVVDGVVQYYSFNTTFDVTPPVITSVTAASVGVTSATITWNTDKSATSRVSYALNSGMTSATTTIETSSYSTAHAVILSGLSAGTTYYYTVFSTDQNGNATSSPNNATTYSFTTVTGSSFLTPPNLSAVAVSSTTPSGATITWTSDTDSDSSVFYTATSSYPGPDRGSYESSVGVPALVQGHSVVLTGLTPSTQYYFFVQSTDASNNVGTSTDPSYTFTTTAGPIISGTGTTSLQETSATVSWTTNVNSDSVLYYSTTANFSNPSTIVGSKNLTTSHAVTITGLTQGTTYYYYVTSTDSSGNKATDNNTLGGVIEYYSFTTVSDNIPPVISAVTTALVGTSGATIEWTTDKGASSRVTYDTDPAFGTATTTSESLVYTTAHAVVLSGLQASTTYYYSVYSADINGNNASSSASGGTQYSFTTEAVGTTTTNTIIQGGGGGGGYSDTTPPTISAVTITQTGADSVNITFTTSEISNGVINYGTTSTYGSQEGDPTIYQLHHSIDLTGLTPLSTYHFSVVSADIFSNTTTAADATFTLVNFSSPTANDNLYNSPTTVSTAPTSASTTIGTVLTANEQAILNAESILETLPANEFTAAIENLAAKVISPPVISGTNITVSPGSHSAEITWTTDKPSNSLVGYSDTAQYAPTASDPYAISSGNPDDSVTSHDIILPNLSPDTTYHFQVRSQGVIGSPSFSDDHTFKTSSALPQVFNTSFTDIGENSASIAWSTDVPTKTKITLKNTQTGVTTNDTETSYSTDHTYSFSNLAFSTPYTITLVASNASSSASAPLVIPFSTVLSGKAAVISNVHVTTSLIPGNVETAQTIVSWMTDKPSTSRIFFGQGTNSNLNQSTTLDPSLTTNHVVITTLLAPGTVYKIKAESSDSSGNVTDSSPYTVLTPAPAGSIVDLIISNLQTTFGVFTK